MVSSTWDQLQQQFARLMALSEAQREQELHQISATQPGLAEQLKRLLDAAQQEVTLSAPVADAVDDLLANENRDRSGETVGAFRLEEKIGAGGMGEVYRASRTDDFEQTVAIKFLKAFGHRADLLKRFTDERQILARLEHPYIARLIDGGTTGDNEPYLVMEYVQGQSLVEYGTSRCLSLNQRLQLFSRIVDAVGFAHRSLVVHRDLKPSNILVTDDGIPRLLDFGIADLIDAENDDAKASVALTPEYASPEQLNNAPVTTLTDVYSLGVLLYQLLTGRLPYTPDPVTVETMRAAIAANPSPLPSQHHSRSVKIDRELDSIVAKALSESVEQRYVSADALLQDIRGYLHSQPVDAMGRGSAYRIRKFIQRNVAAVTAGIAGLLAILVISGFYIVNIQQARDTAQAEADKANAVAGFMEQLFEDVDPGETRGAEITAAQLLEQGYQRVSRDFAELPDVEARLLGVIGRTWRRLGDYQQAHSVHLQAVQRLPAVQADDQQLYAQALFDLAYADYELGNLQEALAGHQQALQLRRSLYQSDHQELADSLRETGLLNQQNGNSEQAEKQYSDALAMYQRLGSGFLEQQAATSMDMAGIEMGKGNREGALQLALQSLDAQIALNGEVHPEVAIATNNISVIHNSLGNKIEALNWNERSIGLREQIYGQDNPITLSAVTNRANMLWGMGHTVTALPLFQRAYQDLLDETAGDSDLRHYFRITDLIRMLITVGELDQAQRLSERIVQRVQDLEGVSDYHRGTAAEVLALTLHSRGQYQSAIPFFEHALTAYNENPDSNVNHINRTRVYAAFANYHVESTPVKAQALQQLVTEQLADKPRPPTESGMYYAYLAEIAEGQGEVEKAAGFADQMLELAANIFAADSIEFADFQVRAVGWYLAAERDVKVISEILQQADATVKQTRQSAAREFPWLDKLQGNISTYRAALAGTL